MPKRSRDYRAGLLEDLRDPNEAADYLRAAAEDSPEMVLLALRDVAEANQMAKVAEEAGVQRESLYRMLSETGNPRYSSLSSVLRALGLRMSIEPLHAPLALGALPAPLLGADPQATPQSKIVEELEKPSRALAQVWQLQAPSDAWPRMAQIS